MNMRIAIYARVSSQKQADERTIQSQRQEIIDRIVRDGLEVEQGFEFCDDGYSGSELLRPALEKLRDRIAGSLVDRLYVHSPDRLARKFAHQALLLEEFRKHDCEVCFLLITRICPSQRRRICFCKCKASLRSTNVRRYLNVRVAVDVMRRIVEA